MNDAQVEQAFRRGILKTTRENIRGIRSRALDSRGVVRTGEDGRNIQEKKQAKRDYYERNKRK